MLFVLFVCFVMLLPLNLLRLIANRLLILLQNLALTGLTDVWSAIRSAASSRLSKILDVLPLSDVQQLFARLLGVSKMKKWME